MNQEILDQSLEDITNENVSSQGKPIHLVNDRSIYFKGFFGLIFCIIPGGIIGLILVKLTLDQAREAINEYERNPDKYLKVSIETVKQGRKMANIGVAIFILEIIVFIVCTSV